MQLEGSTDRDCHHLVTSNYVHNKGALIVLLNWVLKLLVYFSKLGHLLK